MTGRGRKVQAEVFSDMRVFSSSRLYMRSRVVDLVPRSARQRGIFILRKHIIRHRRSVRPAPGGKIPPILQVLPELVVNFVQLGIAELAGSGSVRRAEEQTRRALRDAPSGFGAIFAWAVERHEP